MAVQNLVSATISSETKDEILKAIARIRTQLDFLLSLQADEALGIVKAGKEFLPFIEICHSVANSHPEILSGIFDKAEFDRDHALSLNLGQITDAVGELFEALTHTLTAVRSDDFVGSLDVYSAVKVNKSRVPGLNSVADNLGQYFVKTRKASPALAK